MKLPRLFSRTPAERAMGVKLKPKRRGHGWLKAGAWIAGLVALFAVIGFFVVPPVAKHYLVKNLSELLGRQVAIQEIQVNPFKMTAAVRGVSVSERSGNEVFVSFDELFVNLQAESIFRGGPILEEIRLQRPYVHVVRVAENTYNFSDLLEKFRPDPAKKSDKKDEPHFSLNNIQLTAGKVVFEDKPKAAQHAVTDINIAIPFLSNLPYLAQSYVQPSFSAKVNGTELAARGKTRPFHDSLETQAELNLRALDIPRYVEYVPAKLPFNIKSGLLDAQITASFFRYTDKPPAFIVAGKLALEKFALEQTDGQPLLNFAKLEVPLESAAVFARNIKLGKILLQDPEVFVHRERDGSLNWTRLADSGSGQQAAPVDSETKPLRLQVAEIRIAQGKIHFVDEAAPKPFRTDIEKLDAALQKFALPQTEPATLEVAFATTLGEQIKHASSLTLAPLTVDGSIEVSGVKPRNYAAYFAHLIAFDIEDGTLDASTRFRVAKPEDKVLVNVTGLDASLAKLRLRKRGAKEDFFALPALRLSGIDVDLDKRTAQVAEVASKEARLHIVREKDGTIDLTRLAVSDGKPPAGAPAKPSPPAKSTPSGERWQWSVKKIALERYGVTFVDEVPERAVTHTVMPIRLALENLSNRPNALAKAALDLGVNRTGKVQADGKIGIEPLAAELTLDVEKVDLVPLQPYFGEKLNILVTSGDVLARGALTFRSQAGASPTILFKGDAGLNNFASVDKAKSEDFLKWNSLYVAGIDTTTSPFVLKIQDVALSDFYSRLIIFPTGELNVQNIIAKDGAPPSGEEPATDAKPAPGAKEAPVTKSPPPQTAESAPPPPITIGKVTLQGGNIQFSDFFIKPNYTANLESIGGSVTGLSSQLDTTADVDLRGRFAKTAPVEIKGKLNPLVKNLFLDIKANVRDIELGPFTPYSAKYVGYGIQKGKMSFNVEYKIENRKLTANNRLTLNQLTFGDKVDSPTATKLPVLLAVALLTDRNGVIDVSLPISGSLDDPKFSVGGIVLKIIFNLIEKAVTAPFVLIGSLFGSGGEELAFVEFEPGRTVLDAAADEKLNKLRQALIDRPALKLDVAGHADPNTDREGLLRYRFDQQVKAQKLKELVKQGASVASTDAVTLEPQEYDVYLKRAYKEAKFPKPRNALGMAKDLPKEEMEKLMLTNIAVTDDDLIQLANQRAQAAKTAVTRDEQVPVERVFLLAPKVEAPKGDKQNSGSRVDFSLK